jgi:hypothetical protein
MKGTPAIMLLLRLEPVLLDTSPTAMSEKRIECARVIARLSDFLERKLTPRDHDLVARHIADCEKCRRTLAELEQTITLLSRLPKATPPTRLKSKKPGTD